MKELYALPWLKTYGPLQSTRLFLKKNNSEYRLCITLLHSYFLPPYLLSKNAFRPSNQCCTKTPKVQMLSVKRVSGGGYTARCSPSSPAPLARSLTPAQPVSVSISGCCSERGGSAGLPCSGPHFWEPFPLWLLSGCHFSPRSQGGLWKPLPGKGQRQVMRLL